MRRQLSKAARPDAVVDEEDGAIAAAERAERIMSGTSYGCKTMRNRGQRKPAVVEDTVIQVRGP